MAALNLGATLQRLQRHDPARVRTRARLSSTSISAPIATTTSRSISATCPANARCAFRQGHISRRLGRTTWRRSCITAPTFALDRSRPTIIPKPQYQIAKRHKWAAPALSETDHNMMAVLYFSQMSESAIRTPTEPQRTRFDRADMLLAMERLHGFYMSRMGLQRPAGAVDRRPARLSRHRAVDLRHLPAGALGGFSARARSTSSSRRSRAPTSGGRRTRAARR